MAACFTILAITLVNRRETGLLKRLRLSPLPTWMLMAAMIINAMIVAIMGVVLLLAVGWLGYGVSAPAHLVPFHRHPARRHGLLQRHGGRHEHAGAQRRTPPVRW